MNAIFGVQWRNGEPRWGWSRRPIAYGSLVVTTEGVVVLDYGLNLSDVVEVESGLVQTSGISTGLGTRFGVADGDVASSSIDAALSAQGSGSQAIYLDDVAYAGNAAQMLSVKVDGVDLVLIGGQQGTSLDVYEYDAAIGLVPVFSVSGDDEFHTGLGDDTIFTGGGADTILGSNGTDVIDYGDQAGALVVDLEDASLNAGAAGADTLVNIEGIFGSGQDDTLSGDDEDNVFRGREGNDRIDGRSGDDLLFGGDGNDALWGQDGDDTVFGGAGDDRMPGGAGDDVLYGGDGNDAIGGSYGDDHMFGGDGHDRMGAGPGHDYMEGGAGNDGLAAGADHDTLYGGDGDDRMAGSYGSDSVYGGNGNDRMGGGFGHDLIFGGDGDDVVGAGEHNDTVYGGAGDDLLNTSSGSDEIYGGAGDDQINAGWDDDSISGGTGADVFVFNDFNSGESDVVLDFELGIDQLRMNRIPGADPEAKMERLEITQFGQDTQITWKDHQITLTGILADELTADDFIFIGL